MAEEKIIIYPDDTVSNQDWIKTNSFDFPGESQASLESTFGLNVPFPERVKRLRQISHWPTMRNAPDWLKKEIAELPKEFNDKPQKQNTRRGNRTRMPRNEP